jgi:hypothetical protein
LALQARDEQLRISTVSTLESWAEKDAGLKAQIGDELIEIANVSTNGEARMRALGAIAHLGLPDDVLVEATELLWKEPAEANRSLLATAYEKTGDAMITSTLARLEQAYAQADPSTQRTILGQIARIGKTNAIEILQRLPTNTSPLKQDAENYLAILQSGAVTIAEIDRKKLETERLPRQTSP